jgi:CRISPR system Cascade subunit CasE
MSELWFTRATLKRDAPCVAPLINTLLPPDDGGKLANATHRLLWTLMDAAMQKAGKPNRYDPSQIDKSAFLWRQAEGENCWYVLGPEPRRENELLNVETKPYALNLVAGDRLSFDLTVNATVNRMIDAAKGRDGRKRCDLVLDAMKAEEAANGSKNRPLRRGDIAQSSLIQWLEAQGAKNGFTLEPDTVNLASYQTLTLDRKARSGNRGQVQIGVSSITGLLEITDPALFAAKVENGFGRAKAFGLGLMLLRRSA